MEFDIREKITKTAPEKEKIEFKYFLSEHTLEFSDGCILPESCDNIILLSKEQYSKDEDFLDLMFAFDDDDSDGALYLGHWNDGVK
jgi:hypothetical protein